MLRAESLRRALVPQCSTDVWRKPRRSIPGACLELLGMEGGGGEVQVWCPTWTHWDWQQGTLWQWRTQSPGLPRGRAEEGLRGQDMHRMAPITQDGPSCLSQAGLHPSATGKWVQALSWFPLGEDGSDSSPWGCVDPLGCWSVAAPEPVLLPV